MSKRQRLVLIDGHSLAYRAYFAAANAGTGFSVVHENGTVEPTGAVYFFCNMLLKVLKEQQPQLIAVAFDVGRTFRDDLYSEYKGTREKMPDDLGRQITRIQQVVDAMGMPIFTKDGFEADDVIGTLARRAAGEGMDVVIVSGDRDGTQLVNPAITLMTSGRSFDDIVMYDEQRVFEKYGVKPIQMIDYKALVGDTSDNVPGVRGIGEKTAATLLNEFGSLDGIYANLEKIAAKRARTSLESDRANAYLSRELVTIRTDLDLVVDWAACSSELDYARLIPLLRELKFDSMIKRLNVQLSAAGDASAPAAQLVRDNNISVGGQESLIDPPSEVQPSAHEAPKSFATLLVSSDADFKRLLGDLNSADAIAFDTETTGTDPLTDEIVGMSFAIKSGEAWYLPCHVGAATRPATDTSAGQGALFESNQAPSAPSSDWSLDATSPKFEPIALAMKRAEVELICHNAKFDLAVLQQLGVVFEKLTFDTMLAQFVCDPASPLGLKQLANIHLGWTMTEIKELIGIGKKQISMREVPIALVAPYAAADAAATWELAVILRIQLKQLGQEELLRKVELPLVPVLLEMETNGVAIDVKHLGTVSVEIDARIKELERLIFEHAGGGLFNVNSPQQLSEVLFGRLQLPTDASSRTSTKSKSGATIWSTAAAVLENLRGLHPIIEPILEHRELAKLKGTYVDALPELINKRTGRIHTDFNQAGAITGRLSSSNPNLQNIPVKTEMGRRVRQAFIARKGGRILSADYSQVELRVLAHLADDARMKEAFERNEDIHATTASAVYETPLEFVTPAQRNNAKRINFGIAYGMGAFALAQNTGMTNAEAGEFIKRYFERFPAVKEFLETTKKHAAQQGYVETVLGRRRYFPELSRPGTSEMLKRRAEREAINHPVQGSAADIMKLAMINIHHALHAPHADGRRLQCKMTLQVHDELVFDCPVSEIEEVGALVKHEMETAYLLSVKLRADVHIGVNWDEA